MFLLLTLLAYPLQLLQYAYDALTLAVGGPIYLIDLLTEKLTSLL